MNAALVLIALVTLGAAAVAMTLRNLIHSALLLIASWAGVAAFYLWAAIKGGDDVAFARELYANYNVTVLPGSYLARNFNGHNPGAGRIRMALVAETAECLEAAQRIVLFCRSRN